MFTALLGSLATFKPNFNSLVQPVLKIINILCTFYVVLLKINENFFSDTFYDEHVHVFTCARNAFKEISRVVNTLIDEYLPHRLLTKTVRAKKGGNI